MTVLRYRALSADGTPQDGTIEAVDVAEASSALVARGLLVTALGEDRARRIGRDRRPRIRPDDRITLLREWATLITAGLTVSDALSVSEEGKPPALKATIAALRQAVREGRPLHAALAASALLPQDELVLVETGERSGTLARVIEQIATDQAERRLSERGLATALIYPCALLVTTVAALLVITLVVAPNLAELFAEAGREPPPRIALLLLLAASAKIVLPAAAMLMTAAGFGLHLVARKLEGRRRRDAALVGLPVLGRFLRSRDGARFASSAAMMIDAGLVPTAALPLAARTVRNAAIRARLERALGQAARGTALQDALRRSGALPLDMVALIGAGMRAGRLSDVLRHGGMLHASRARAHVERLSALLTPAITVFAGFVVGGLAYLVMTAVLSLNDIALP
jgi:general secretion pathway protein F